MDIKTLQTYIEDRNVKDVYFEIDGNTYDVSQFIRKDGKHFIELKRVKLNCVIKEPIYEEDLQAQIGYAKCHSCNHYFPGSHPEHGYRMCEDCVG